MENADAKSFVSTAEFVLILVGFFAGSPAIYAGIAFLMICALCVYVFWSLKSPVVMQKPSR